MPAQQDSLAVAPGRLPHAAAGHQVTIRCHLHAISDLNPIVLVRSTPSMPQGEALSLLLAAFENNTGLHTCSPSMRIHIVTN